MMYGPLQHLFDLCAVLWKKAKKANYVAKNVANLHFFTLSFKKYTYQSNLMGFLFYKD